jgi:hypothetical protein
MNIRHFLIAAFAATALFAFGLESFLAELPSIGGEALNA